MTNAAVSMAKGFKELSRRKLSLFQPHPKQAIHLELGASKRERALFAANRSGKTHTCGCEGAYHATGLYPDWWKGKRFFKATFGWACGVSNETTRDIVQKELMGASELEWGTGALPASSIIKTEKARSIAGAVDKVYVKHVSGGVSCIQFKSYEQGWEKFTGAECDWIWFDEEPPEMVYSEGLTRTNNTNGVVFLSLTPLQGQTSVVSHFFPRPDSQHRALTMMTIDDALHFTQEQREVMVEQYQPYEREARLKGIPMLGSGRVFPVSEEKVRVADFVPPPEWPSLIGMDFGWDHPTAATLIRWDRETDCIYVTKEYRVSEEAPFVHARAISDWGSWPPVMWPHDGHRKDGRGGPALKDEYAKEGLRMHHEHATFENGSNSLEAGVLEMLDRMRTNRWKVFASCAMWFEEFRSYHRKDGKIVDALDDLLCASRYAMMMRRFARTDRPRVKRPTAPDWDPLEGERVWA
jgi:phage terminase large subunit-like protein